MAGEYKNISPFHKEGWRNVGLVAGICTLTVIFAPAAVVLPVMTAGAPLANAGSVVGATFLTAAKGTLAAGQASVTILGTADWAGVGEGLNMAANSLMPPAAAA